MRIPPISIVKVDFGQASRVTDSGQFYENEDGTPRPGGGGKYPEVEYDAIAGTGCPYVVNLRTASSITVQITFKNPLIREITGTWGCEDPDFLHNSCVPNVHISPSVVIASNTIDLPAFGTQTVTMFLSGFGSAVERGDFTCSIWCHCPPDDGGNGFLSEKLYFTDAMPAGLMGTPWAEVLDCSCVYADGQSGKTATMHKCTTGLYDSGLFTYDGSASFHIEMKNDAHLGYFRLKPLFAHEDEPNADCRDVSSFLSLCTASQGYPGTLTQGWLPTGGYPVNYPFRTSNIQGIGTTGYASTDWNFHQFLEDSGYVYDACAAQERDLAGGLYDAPPWGSAWPRLDYWQKSNGSGDFWGLVRGYEDTIWHVPAVATPTFVPALTLGPGSGSPALLQGTE